MKALLIVTMLALTVCGVASAQSFDKLKISKEELPAGYSFTDQPQCQAIQACLFYKQTDIYSALIGKIKAKEIQNFSSTTDSGSIMFFEFEDDIRNTAFIEGLLWGKPEKPTKEHPEEFISKGKMLVIFSFKMKSDLKKLAQEKINKALK